MGLKWLFFFYSVSAEPLRAMNCIAMSLKRLGAVHCQSFWVLPLSDEHVKAVRELMAVIKDHEGESLLIEGGTLCASAHPSCVTTRSRVEDEDKQPRGVPDGEEAYACQDSHHR